MRPEISAANLTGTDSATPTTHSASVAAALGKLRFGVLLCGWVTGAALLVQMVIWALAHFTELRWSTLTAEQQAPLVVNADETGSRGRSPFETVRNTGTEHVAVDANRVPSTWNSMFSTASELSGGFGTLGVLLLTPLMILGVLLSTSSGLSGVDKCVSAFGWTLVVSLLVLPIGGLINLPWPDGALPAYGRMCEQIERAAAAGEGVWRTSDSLVFYTRYLLLPLTCIAGVAMACLRFTSAIEEGLVKKEVLRLDRILEAEAANIKASSLHGGRAAGAMKQIEETVSAGAKETTPAASRTSIKQPGAGEMPRRLI